MAIRITDFTGVTEHPSGDYEYTLSDDRRQTIPGDFSNSEGIRLKAWLDAGGVALPFDPTYGTMTLAEYKTQKKSIISENVRTKFNIFVDHHYKKQYRKAQGGIDYVIPAAVEAYENALINNQDASDIVIDAFKTFLEVYNHDMVWPTIPKETN